MQLTNGHYNDEEELAEEETPKSESAPKKPWQPPAHVITRGDVVTRIWANPNHWGEITWRIDQRVIDKATPGRWYRKSIPGNCLRDAVLGLYLAQEWIARTQNPRGLWRLLPWNWF